MLSKHQKIVDVFKSSIHGIFGASCFGALAGKPNGKVLSSLKGNKIQDLDAFQCHLESQENGIVIMFRCLCGCCGLKSVLIRDKERDNSKMVETCSACDSVTVGSNVFEGQTYCRSRLYMKSFCDTFIAEQ